MDLLPSDEQQEIVAAVSAFLVDELPMTRLRELFAEPSNVDRTVWSKCAGLGWFGLGLDETFGGVGFGLPEEALLFREIGRHLAPGPLLSTVLGARTAAVAGRGAVAAEILDGTRVVGLAQPLDDAPLGRRITGDLDLLDGVGADLILVTAPDAVALVEAAALSSFSSVRCIDPASRLGRARADDLVPLAVVSGADEQIFLRGAVLTSAMLSGIAEAARDLAAEHARTRVQFGKPIGVHQAVKHACTDMAVSAEAAACQTFLAAMTLDLALGDAELQVASAKVVAIDAAIRNSRANIQIHGGMGFTWEHDAHLLLKRAHMLAGVCGDRRYHLGRLVDLPAARSGR